MPLRKLSIALALVSVAALLMIGYGVMPKYTTWLFTIFIAVTLWLSLYPRLLIATGMAAVLVGVLTHYSGDVKIQGRNFFSPYAVYDVAGTHGAIRFLGHGSTVHGVQQLDTMSSPQKSDDGYYPQNNPIRDVLSLTDTKTLAVLGLGSGQMACYDPALVTDFYEIDPDMLMVANNYFTYLKHCPPRDIFMGDGRQEIKKQNRIYDVIMMDAFTSDSVPLHLVTREALHEYREQISPKGAILFHISNRYLKLAPPLAAVAQAEGLQAYRKFYRPEKDETKLRFLSQWLAVPMDRAGGEALEKKGWVAVEPHEAPWTDDRSSLWEALSFNTAD